MKLLSSIYSSRFLLAGTLLLMILNFITFGQQRIDDQMPVLSAFLKTITSSVAWEKTISVILVIMLKVIDTSNYEDFTALSNGTINIKSKVKLFEY